MGKDFSLTMIIEGLQSSVTRAEIVLPKLCQQHDLLSMMKRTSEHSKQNIEHLFSLDFSGVDSLGIVTSVTSVFVAHDVSVTAFRQRTFVDENTAANMMSCKMMLSAPQQVDVNALQAEITATLKSLGLAGTLIDKQIQE
jgi:glycine cleavage system transcriptional repressor